MSLEQTYKLGSWLKNSPDELPKAVVEQYLSGGIRTPSNTGNA